MARKREFNAFSLSFLDIMSCGFGAVILLYLIINHASETVDKNVDLQLLAQVKKLEQEVLIGEENLVELKITVDETEDDVTETQGTTLEVLKEIEKLSKRIEELSESGASTEDTIESLKTELKLLEEDTAILEGSVSGDETAGTSLRAFVGQGNRQYLTGLNVGGERILILLDSSASMLHGTIVNAIRLNNMGKETKIAAEKWQRAVRTIDWVVANLPKDAEFQIVTFDVTAKQLGKNPGWQKTIDVTNMDQTLAALAELEPTGGTSLHAPFAYARQMNPRPDNIYLITDGLPTQGEAPDDAPTVSSRQRAKYFFSAVNELPDEIPVNIILFPMEGDPQASPNFWILAQLTAGAFMAPARDWP
jgi:hypothetical protein